MSTVLQLTVLCLFLLSLAIFIFYRKNKTVFFIAKRNSKRDFEVGTGVECSQNKNSPDEWGMVDGVRRIETASKHFIVIRLMAPKNTSYVGYELMQALLSGGLRYGSHNIFHYHEETGEEEKILFSLASAVEPGTFELSQMGSITCPGLTLFMEYSSNSETDPLNRLTLMLDTARQLSEDLGGQLFADTLKPLTENDIKKWRIQFESYEQNKKMGDLLTAV
jgi:cell division protein ZipA